MKSYLTQKRENFMINMVKKVLAEGHKLQDFQISLISLEWEDKAKEKLETNKRKSSLLPKH